MRINNNTVLVTGGGSGIGFEIARQLSELGNKTVLIGRNHSRLAAACEIIPNSEFVQCDITVQSEVDCLVETVYHRFPGANILVNNAGKAYGYTLTSGNSFEKAREEITTNYLSTVRLVDKLLPLLMNNREAAIVNNSSVTALVPVAILPTYSASKAALHSYTQSLRMALQGTGRLRIFELLPPLVDTEFSKGLPGHKIPASYVALELLEGMRNDQYEINVGATAEIYRMYLQSPSEAIRYVNKGS
jgi:uncharacterized oxidoreductase